MSARRSSKYSILNNFSISYDFKFDPVKAYLKESQNMIQNLNKDLKAKFDRWDSEKDPNSDIPDAYDFYETDIMNVRRFDSILNNSTFLTIYSLFENEFLDLCLWCQAADSLKLGPKDINGRSYIDQCRKFITKLLDVDLGNLNTEWELIQKYRLIRNSITHKEGKIVQPSQNLLYFIEETSGVQYDDERNQITIDSIEFPIKFIDIVTKYLTGVCEAIINQKS